MAVKKTHLLHIRLANNTASPADSRVPPYERLPLLSNAAIRSAGLDT